MNPKAATLGLENDVIDIGDVVIRMNKGLHTIWLMKDSYLTDISLFFISLSRQSIED
jgi:hypothetical protein